MCSIRVVERLVCMDAGRIIADGEPEAVMRRRRRDRRLPRGRGRMSLLERRTSGRAPRPARGRPRRQPRSRRGGDSSRWSAPTAPARRRCCARSPAPIEPAAGAYRLRRRRRHRASPPIARLRTGIALVPEGRRLFAGDDRQGEPAGRRQPRAAGAVERRSGGRGLPAVAARLEPARRRLCPAASSRRPRSAAR